MGSQVQKHEGWQIHCYLPQKQLCAAAKHLFEYLCPHLLFPHFPERTRDRWQLQASLLVEVGGRGPGR